MPWTNGFVNATARLALQTAHRQGVESSGRSVVLFIKGECKQVLAAYHQVWRGNAAKPPAERPPERPRPWREQVGQQVLKWILQHMESQVDEQVQALLQELKMLPVCLEAVQHGVATHDETAWPVVLVFRNSDTASRIKEDLSPLLAPVFGRGKELGVRPARHQPSGSAKAVMGEMGFDTQKGFGKGKRHSPKREAFAASPTHGDRGAARQRR
eukprot:s395_g16.t1